MTPAEACIVLSLATWGWMCPHGLEPNHPPTWALLVASTSDWENVGVYPTLEECSAAGRQQAAHYTGDGELLYKCIKD